MLLRVAASLVLITACVDDTSQDSQASAIADGGRHGPPPAEAFAACDGLVADATCTFDIDGHHIDGTCRTGPDGDGELACAPKRRPPPPEAFDACDGATVDAACSFDIDGHHVEGTCRSGPDGDGPLGCAPPQPPPQN